jgi:hypothetical protein
VPLLIAPFSYPITSAAAQLIRSESVTGPCTRSGHADQIDLCEYVLRFPPLFELQLSQAETVPPSRLRLDDRHLYSNLRSACPTLLPWACVLLVFMLLCLIPALWVFPLDKLRTSVSGLLIRDMHSGKIFFPSRSLVFRSCKGTES